MKTKLISFATNLYHPGAIELKRSLDTFEWNYEFINGPYINYGSKMVRAYEYAKQTDCTHLFIVDAYDVFVLDSMEEALSRIEDKDSVIFNAEQGCWPYDQWEYLYPPCESRWKYLNGGAAFVSVKRFIKMFEDHPIQHLDNDQVNLAKLYLTEREKYKIKLDTNCEVFQSVAFEKEGEFAYNEVDGFIYNLKTNTTPIIIHGNGGTSMKKFYHLI